jgi:magnesium transporter
MTTYLSISDQKNNDVVKLLTIFSVFFLPLTFIVGVYGMNFEFMPELKWKFGYLFSFSLMALVVIVIYIWFKRKKII